MSAGKSFVGGFFGCFGVAAAILFALAALGMCSIAGTRQTSQRPPSEAGPRPDYNSLTFAGHCVNGLFQAQERGLIDGQRSALEMPWAIYRVGGSESQPILRCNVTEKDQARHLRVEVVCLDDAKEECTRFVSLETPNPYGAPSQPTGGSPRDE